MSLKMSCNIGIAVSSHPRPKAAMATNRVKPIITPAMCGQVARKPKLALEAASRRLLGPGVKPNEQEIPINKNNSGCIKFKLLEAHSLIVEMGELV